MGETQPAESKSAATACSAPPLGVMPKRFWIERRFWDLAEACNRYMEVDMPIPNEWIDEMRQHFRTATRKADPAVVAKWRHWLSVD